MSPILATIVVLGAVITLVTFAMAIRAGVSAFVAQARLRRELASEVERLARRTGELQTRTARLEESTRELPGNVSRIQENLAELRVLSGNLYVTLSQARRMLSSSGIKSSGTSWLSKTARRQTRSLRG
ncbi:hypothetical protein BH24ACT16_BH24ACT16_05830 [soil metagenome]|jgi:hypothetical protein